MAERYRVAATTATSAVSGAHGGIGPVSVSIGSSLYAPASDVDIDHLVLVADAALLRGQAGRPDRVELAEVSPASLPRADRSQ